MAPLGPSMAECIKAAVNLGANLPSSHCWEMLCQMAALSAWLCQNSSSHFGVITHRGDAGAGEDPELLHSYWSFALIVLGFSSDGAAPSFHVPH